MDDKFANNLEQLTGAELTLNYIILKHVFCLLFAVAVLDYDDDGEEEDEYYDEANPSGVGENERKRKRFICSQNVTANFSSFRSSNENFMCANELLANEALEGR